MGDFPVKDEITVSVRGLVEFILRSGDIDTSGAGPSGTDVMLKGSRLHRKLQGMRGPGYMAEVPLKIRVPYDEYDIIVEGRADGIYTDPDEEPGICIEENIENEGACAGTCRPGQMLCPYVPKYRSGRGRSSVDRRQGDLCEPG